MSSISPTSSTSNLLSSLSPTSSSQNSSGVSFTGLASGLNTDQIINAVLSVDQARVTNLQNNQDQFTQEQTAFGTVEASLLDLQSNIFQLGRAQDNVFNLRTVNSSDTTQLTAAATSDARPGIYTVQVTGLARAQIVASQGLNSPSATITQGTFQLRVGTGAATTITINSGNNTLQGLADAINASGAGVTAAIVNDGTANGTQAYRLVLTANQTGTSNSISITNNLGADGGGAVRPVFDSNYLGQAIAGSGYTGTSTPTSNAGTGNYTGTSNNVYTFTVANGGTVGTDNNIQLSYTDTSGTHTGTITLSSSDVNTFKTVAQGIQVEFGAGTLVTGQTFSVKAFVPSVQQAANASVSVGSGSGAITVQSATDQIDGVIPGVTLNLVGSNPTTPVVLTVGADTDKANTAIQDFVTSYNKLVDTIANLTSFDPNTNTAGILLGNQDLELIQNELTGTIASAVPGVNSQLSTLAAIGITLDQQGHLNVDDTKLSAVLSGQTAGVSLTNVQDLFALAGSSTNPGVQFVVGSDRTQASPTGYQVDVTQAATQASITAANPLASSTVIDNTNNALTVTIDGQATNVTLASGTYTPQQLAQELQSEINAVGTSTGRQVNVGLNGSQLTVTSAAFGSASQVQIGSGTALGALGFAGTEASHGSDVIGNFVVNGVVEPATGIGQFLSGNSTNAHTADLEVRVQLNQSQISTQPVATVNVTRGVASSLGVVLGRLLDPATGRLKSITDGLQTTINDIGTQIQEQNNLIASRRQSLVQQFTATEQAISRLQTISGFLNQQFSLLNNLSSTSSSGTPRPIFGA
jgi:flagellar hook-associated protein 2